MVRGIRTLDGKAMGGDAEESCASRGFDVLPDRSPYLPHPLHQSLSTVGVFEMVKLLVQLLVFPFDSVSTKDRKLVTMGMPSSRPTQRHTMLCIRHHNLH